MTFQVTIIFRLGFCGGPFEIVLGYFYYDRLIGIFGYEFFGSHSELEFYTSDFGLQTSNFKSLH